MVFLIRSRDLLRRCPVMRANIRVFVGLDVHKDSIAIAYADANFNSPPRFLGTTKFSVISLTKALSNLGRPVMRPVRAVTASCDRFDSAAIKPR
jgi:hypothetical protein